MRCLIVLIVGLAPWLSVRGGPVEHWGSGATEVKGTSQSRTLVDQTHDTSANDTPEPTVSLGDPEEEDIETNEGYATETKATGAEEGDDGASDIAMEEDDLAQANPGVNLDPKKAKSKGQSAASPDAEAQDNEADDADTEDGDSATEEGSLDAADDGEDTDNEGA